MMDSKHPPPKSVPGILHYIPPDLSAFEPLKPLLDATDVNTIVWVGGLSDTLLSVTYPLRLAKSLDPSWSLMLASLSSSGLQFGVKSVAEDARDLAKIIAYIQSGRPSGKIVIMGHSTGCQDCLHYITGSGFDKRPGVQGVILQAPVSDREALEMILPEAHVAEANQTALEWCRTKRGGEVLASRLTSPVFGKAPVTARRWVDLASPPPNRNGADDMFSSDLSIERLNMTFGRIPAGVPLLTLYSGNDEAVPARVKKEELVAKWTTTVKQAGGLVDENNSGIVPHATHNLNDCPESVSNDLIRRVLGFLKMIDTERSSTSYSSGDQARMTGSEHS